MTATTDTTAAGVGRWGVYRTTTGTLAELAAETLAVPCEEL
jgi:hypothetical protein